MPGLLKLQEKHDKSPAHKGSEKVSPELQRQRLRTEISEAQEAYTTMGTPKGWYT